MKEKIINYIETLEAKAYQSDDYFKQRNDLYIENQNKEKEIERLNKERETDIKYNKYLQKELAEAHSIIKEVREYIMTNGIHSDYGDKGIDDENKLLEILDKENK